MTDSRHGGTVYQCLSCQETHEHPSHPKRVFVSWKSDQGMHRKPWPEDAISRINKVVFNQITRWLNEPGRDHARIATCKVEGYSSSGQ